jgi:hypothetical protein
MDGDFRGRAGFGGFAGKEINGEPDPAEDEERHDEENEEAEALEKSRLVIFVDVGRKAHCRITDLSTWWRGRPR